MRVSTFFLTFLLLSLATSFPPDEHDNTIWCNNCVETLESGLIGDKDSKLDPVYSTAMVKKTSPEDKWFMGTTNICSKDVKHGTGCGDIRTPDDANGKCGVMTTTGNRNGKPFREIVRTCFPVSALKKWGLSLDGPDCKNISKFAVKDDSTGNFWDDKNGFNNYSNVDIDMCWCNGGHCNDKCLSAACYGGGERSKSSWVRIFLGVVVGSLTAWIISW